MNYFYPPVMQTSCGTTREHSIYQSYVILNKISKPTTDKSKSLTITAGTMYDLTQAERHLLLVHTQLGHHSMVTIISLALLKTSWKADFYQAPPKWCLIFYQQKCHNSRSHKHYAFTPHTAHGSNKSNYTHRTISTKTSKQQIHTQNIKHTFYN